MSQRKRSEHVAAAALLAFMAASVGALWGCFTVAAGDPGASAAIYVTSRGVTSLLTAPLDTVAAAARGAFADLGVSMDAIGSTTAGRRYSGSKGDLKVDAELKSTDAGTEIEVTARSGAFVWDKAYARRVLARIITRQGYAVHVEGQR